MSNLIKIAGLWKNQSNNGEHYLSCRIGEVKFYIFKNNYKNQDNQPDYNLFIDSETYKSLDNDIRKIIAAQTLYKKNNNANNAEQNNVSTKNDIPF